MYSHLILYYIYIYIYILVILLKLPVGIIIKTNNNIIICKHRLRNRKCRNI